MEAATPRSANPWFAAALVLWLASGCGTGHDAATAPESLATSRVPATRTVDVVDDYHGTKVADPYRWLEEPDSEETRAWTAAQNAATQAYLGAVPERGAIRARLTALWNQPRLTAPERAGDWWIFRRNDGLQNQAVICRTRAPGAAAEVVLDPNTLSADGTTSVGAFEPSPDGTLAAYTIARAGSDWQEWHVLEIATGAARPDLVPWSKFAGASWARDGSGFYYTRYPEPAAGEAFEAVNEAPQVCFHRLGTPSGDDRVVFERRDQPRLSLSGEVTDDGHYLLIRSSVGTDPHNGIAVVDLTAADAAPRELLPIGQAAYRFVDADGPRLFFVTDFEAPRARLVAIDVAQPEPAHWQTLLPEGAHRLADVALVGDHFVVTHLRDASHVLTLHTLDGGLAAELALPELGSLSSPTGKRADRVTFFTFESFTSPAAVLGYDFDRRELTTLYAPALADHGAAVTRQVFYASRDGTRVPMFLVHRPDVRLDGASPALLFGYGGFDTSLLPRYSAATLAWVERGGIFAQANLRGGGEYGEAWHRAGEREHKQNVFDDFVTAAEYLVRNGYTRPDNLAIWGRSNGGLLVGASLTQRPDLFGAAIVEVGVLDMLRYHRFTIGWAWAPEYGRSDDPTMFPVLHAYSPLHRIRAATRYPATLVMTGDHDDRVLPGHSYKFAAALQAAQSGPAPVLLRVETAAGHGASTPTTKQIEAATDRLAFLIQTLAAR